jgi:aminopeptidase-like protein
MVLSDQILNFNNFEYQLQLTPEGVGSLTNCWLKNFDQKVENPEFFLKCFQQNKFEESNRVKRDEHIMKKIVNAYSDVFGSHSKTQKK